MNILINMTHVGLGMGRESEGGMERKQLQVRLELLRPWQIERHVHEGRRKELQV